ncbi:MAG: ATP-binding cassette domain-containing protein, partial [Candidatus Korarchaeota archaeon]|nr:ATP-binding cassette domain-containing protein [Candidatus Korarchaeota archaeon]
MIALEVEGLTKMYGEVRALDFISFHVNEGEIFGLLGPNGSGKTTLMEIIAGVRAPTSGSVKVFGLDALREREKVSRLIGFNPQETMLYGDLSGWENLRFVASLYGMDDREFRR